MPTISFEALDKLVRRAPSVIDDAGNIYIRFGEPKGPIRNETFEVVSGAILVVDFDQDGRVCAIEID